VPRKREMRRRSVPDATRWERGAPCPDCPRGFSRFRPDWLKPSQIWRRRTGIEPARDDIRRLSPILKTKLLESHSAGFWAVPRAVLARVPARYHHVASADASCVSLSTFDWTHGRRPRRHRPCPLGSLRRVRRGSPRAPRSGPVVGPSPSATASISRGSSHVIGVRPRPGQAVARWSRARGCPARSCRLVGRAGSSRTSTGARRERPREPS
jgi:hypothetical protein